MGFFVVDESIHDRGGFILAALVFCREDPARRIDDALRAIGLTPGQDEFKSGSRMQQNERRHHLRGAMKEILSGAKLGIVVTPLAERYRLGNYVLDGVEKIVRANRLDSNRNLIYIDDGITVEGHDDAIARFRSLVGGDLHLGQDSRDVRDLQLADLAAHTLAIMLLDQLGLVKKTVKVGQNSGYPPDLDIGLGFEMWATVRRLFFTQDELDLNLILDSDPIQGWTLRTADYAVHIAAECAPELRRAALDRFGKMYVGCIH